LFSQAKDIFSVNLLITFCPTDKSQILFTSDKSTVSFCCQVAAWIR
jgi:hypothetical protein